MRCKLGDYIRIKHGFAFKGEYITAENNGVVLVTPGNFEIGGGFKEDKCKYFNGDYPKEYVLSPYDLIVTMTDLSKQGDTLGYSALVPKTNRVYLHNQRIGLVDVYNPKADKLFIYWLMRTQKYQKTIVATSSGSTVKHTSPSRIYDVEVDLPPIDVQKKIAAILSALDEKIAINRAINDNLYHSLSLSFKNDYWDKAIDHSEWVMTTLDETTSRFGTGLNPRKNFVLGHGNNYYVTIKNMGNNRIYLDDRCDKIDDEAIRKIQMRSDLKVGDLLFSGIGTIGRVFLIDKPATNWNTSESVFNLRPNAKVSSEFLYLLLLNNDMQDYAISLASGSVQKGIRMADLKKYSFFLPTSDVIKRLTSLWKPLIKQIKANEVESDSLAVLRDTLLPKLMSGEIDVSAVQL